MASVFKCNERTEDFSIGVAVFFFFREKSKNYRCALIRIDALVYICTFSVLLKVT